MGLPNIANISCCKILVKFAQMQKVITSNLHLGQVENEAGLVIWTQHCQKCHSRHEPRDTRWGDCRDHTILSSFIKLMITQQIWGKYSEKCSFELSVVMAAITWAEWFEWVDNWYRNLPANILQTSPHTTHSGSDSSKHSDRQISNRDVCRHESDQRWIKHFNFRFYGWLQILSLLRDEDIYNI